MNISKLDRFPPSSTWDHRTQAQISTLRSFIHRHPQPTISSLQHSSIAARPLKSSFHSSQVILQAPPEDDIRQLLFRAITELGNDAEYEAPELADVPVECISNASSAQEVTQSRLSEQGTSLTILHVHGGGFFQGSPSAYRPTTTRLAEITGGRVVSIDYRLAPQHPFPAAQLDVLVAYLSLLYPAASSDAKPLSATRIVFVGDSVGGSLLYNILQIIQKTAKHAPIQFHSHTVHFPLPKPAGIATLSLAGEHLQCMPSHTENLVHDLYLDIPWSLPNYPTCALWPTNPPRPLIPASAKTHAHPLLAVSLHSSWADAPAMWFAVGEEQLIDSSKAVARRAARDGVSVTWIQFEAMPHCFATLPGLNRSRQADILFEKLGRFCRECVEGEEELGQNVRAVTVSFKDAEELPLELDSEIEEKRLPLADLEKRVRDKIDKIEKEFSLVCPKL